MITNQTNGSQSDSWQKRQKEQRGNLMKDSVHNVDSWNKMATWGWLSLETYACDLEYSTQKLILSRRRKVHKIINIIQMPIYKE